jgi:NADH-quinone oxidoreductase subunit N
MSIIFSFTLFSLAGIPPLVGFYAKFCVFHSAINCGYFFIAIFIILTSVISAFYYLRLIKKIYFENSLKNR